MLLARTGTLALLLAIALATVASGASRQAAPDTPAGKEYAIPLDTARHNAGSGGSGSSGHAGGSSSSGGGSKSSASGSTSGSGSGSTSSGGSASSGSGPPPWGAPKPPP